MVFHGGCTTGVCQVNDTDLHASLEREYLAVEAISFYEQQSIDPGNISRTRQQVSPTANIKQSSASQYVRFWASTYVRTCAFGQARTP